MSMKILESCQISPPPGSVPPTHLPLTFFDFPWLLCCPMQRLFFYHLPQPLHHFTLTVLPNLKHSLSLALRLFFPFAANLVCPPPPHKPHLLFSPGASVSLTVAESSFDFSRLVSDHPRDVTEIHPFVPKLGPASSAADGTRLLPLLALQVTVFPNSGISIGAVFNHVAADGMAFNHFMKSWAFISRTTPSDQDLTFLDESAEPAPPSHDRDAIADPYRLEPILLKIWWETMASTFEEHVGRDLQDMIRDTFVLGRAHILKLKHWVLAQCLDEEEASSFHASAFVVTCAFIWVHLIRSHTQQQTQADSEMINEMDHLCFAADCRNRKGFEYPIPVTYFGNCLAICFVSVKRSELVGENGIFAAAKAIGKRVKELEGGALRGAEKWMSDWKEASETGNLVTVAGSPKLGVYKTDFGWGRPRKSQVVHTDVVSAISLAESRDEEGGIEIGMSLHMDQMHIFNACSQQTLKLL